MNQTEFTNLLKQTNAVLRTNASAAVQADQAAQVNDIANRLRWLGADPTLYDYPNGTVVMNAVTGNANSTVFDVAKDAFKTGLLIRIAATGTTTPTCTYAIQGSKDSSTWVAADFADNSTPTSFGNSTFVLTPTGTTQTVIKVVRPGQSFRYIRVVTSANTNVTNTVDISSL